MVQIIKPADASKTDVVHGEDIDYIEYGILYPNGRTSWSSLGGPRFRGVNHERLNLKIEQEKAQKAFQEQLEYGGVFYDPELHKLRFVTRLHQVRFTKPVALAAEELQEFQASEEVA